jgi:hypothetical protein
MQPLASASVLSTSAAPNFWSASAIHFGHSVPLDVTSVGRAHMTGHVLLRGACQLSGEFEEPRNERSTSTLEGIGIPSKNRFGGDGATR